tara:strand:+ start:154 stop:1269 length:1116 start_codon:yes stop_codon:yes gene_type:complete
MKLTETYIEFLVESIDNLPEIFVKGVRANDISEMDDVLRIFGGVGKVEISLPLFGQALLNKGNTEAFTTFLKNMWQWDDHMYYITLLIGGINDVEFNFKTVILPELEDMWSDLVVEGDKYYFDVMRSEMWEFFDRDHEHTAKEVFSDEGLWWDTYSTNPDLEPLFYDDTITDKTYIEMVKHIGKEYENVIVMDIDDKFTDWVEEDQIPEEEHSFFLTHDRLNRYFNLEHKMEFVALLGDTVSDFEEYKSSIKYLYDLTYNEILVNQTNNKFYNAVYDILGEPKYVGIETYGIKGKTKVDGYRFDITEILESFVMVDFFPDNYTDPGSVLESLNDFKYMGLGELHVRDHQDYVDDTEEEFISLFNRHLIEEL